MGPNNNPLEWIMLVKNGNEALLVTKQVIDGGVQYNENRKGNTWENCTLRAYLNNDFIKHTFSSEEQARIKQVKLVNKYNEKYGTSGSNDTADKIFCLSIDEVNEYFIDDEERVAEFSGGGGWWLRSPGRNLKCAALVGGSGWVNDCGTYVDYDYVGIRPALWLNLES